MERNVMVEGCYNVRDLGGYPTADGHTTRWKVFVRAGNLSSMVGEGYRQLTDYGIKTIVDLRDSAELVESPNNWVHTSELHYLNLPLFGHGFWQSEDWQRTKENHQHLHEHYTYYLENCQPQITAVMNAVIEHTPGVLFHCWMGKDRTGLIASLLLGAVNVPAEIIVDDYAQTTAHYAEEIPKWRVKAIERGEDVRFFERDVFSLPETMIETLAYLDSRYGGVREYLTITCGISTAQLNALREKFVE